MRNKIIYILFLILIKNGSCQNLVPNFSFEDRSSCTNYYNDLLYWINPNGATPDYFHSCWTFNLYGSSPNNYMGNELPFSGNGYVGLIAFHGQAPNGREYIQVKLNQTLNYNKKYYTSFRLSLADSSLFYVKKVCTSFSQNAISSNNYDPISFSPQVCSDSLVLLDEDKGWKKIGGFYTATGIEDYLTIGNFYNDTSTDTIRRTGNYPYLVAYYYIDDVSVIPIPEIEAGPDVQIIQGNNSQFNATIENGWNGLQYRWRPSVGLSDSTILNPIASPSQTTIYYLHLIDTSGTASFVDTIIDSLKVTVVPNGIDEIRESVQKINIYPNPANTIISISGMSGMNEIVIFDPLGQVILPPLLGRGAGGEVNIENLPTGMYFVRVRSEKNEAVGKFVKQ